MNGNNGADELDLDDSEFDQPLALVRSNLQAAQQTADPRPPPQSFSLPRGQQFTAPQPTFPPSQAPENRIPGPAGRPATQSNNSQGNNGNYSAPTDFNSPEWQAAFEALNLPYFDGNCPFLNGNTVSAAKTLKNSGTLARLLVQVISIQHAHNGESYVKFADPTGTIGGTLVSNVLSLHPTLTKGAVVLLEKITVLKTPAPHVLHHLCVVPEIISRIFPSQHRRIASSPFGGNNNSSRGGGWQHGGGNSTQNQQQQQQPPRLLENHQPLAQNNNNNNNNSSMPPPPPRQPIPSFEQQQPTMNTMTTNVPSPPPIPNNTAATTARNDDSSELLAGLDDEFGF